VTVHADSAIMIVFGVSSTPELLTEGSRVEDCAQHRRSAWARVLWESARLTNLSLDPLGYRAVLPAARDRSRSTAQT
jgi:hypothetical protein